MSDLFYRYVFVEDVPLSQIQVSLELAYIGLDGLFGGTRVQLEARHALNADANAVVIDGSGEVGAVLNRLFAAFVLEEMEEGRYSIERLSFAADLCLLN